MHILLKPSLKILALKKKDKTFKTNDTSVGSLYSRGPQIPDHRPISVHGL